jgi:hypothetical protein
MSQETKRPEHGSRKRKRSPPKKEDKKDDGREGAREGRREGGREGGRLRPVQVERVRSHDMHGQALGHCLHLRELLARGVRLNANQGTGLSKGGKGKDERTATWLE